MTTTQTSHGTTPLGNFKIPDFVKDKYPHLIPLILETESMSDEERQYWFSIMPIMNSEQIKKLEGILLKEKQELQSLDEEYNQELKHINDKHMIQWKAFEAREKRKKLKQKESSLEKSEAEEEANLLKKLQDM
ncbi:MAG: hypothetical protein AAB592_00375 [Patescibacteria group bacterium]